MNFTWAAVLLLAGQPATAPATAPATTPDEVRHGMSMNEPREVRYARYFERLARQIEPDLKGDPSKIDVYLRFFEREMIYDRRIIAFNVNAEQNGPQIHLTGFAEYPELIGSLTEMLQAMGIDQVESRVAIAPTMGPEMAFAVVRALRAFIRSGDGREVINEVLEGEPIYLLAAAGDSFWCHAPDGYIGTIKTTDLSVISREEFNKLLCSPPKDVARIEGVIASAKSKLGLPYVWGGRSDKGVDCSGLVQTAFASQGINLPRDAEEQASVGRLVATRWHRDALRRGDLLFFLGRRGLIAHTAVYLGDKQMIEAADSGVKISSFDPTDTNYAKHRDETFCLAKRVLE